MEHIYASGDMAKIYKAIFKSCEEITEMMRFEPVSMTSDTNDFGEQQFNVDKDTDDIIYKNLKDSGVVYSACSEESTQPRVLNEDGNYTITFDPLDGSSIVEANFAVGSIFGIWPKSELIGVSCREMIGACLAIYGTKTCAVVYDQEKDQVDELSYRRVGDEKKWVITDENIRIAEDAKTFAPGNLRVAKELTGYKNLILWYIDAGKTLRYSGGVAPDVFHILNKKEGVFFYPVKERKNAKLRVLYECAPLAFLVEKAGGIAIDGEIPTLDTIVDSYEIKCPVYLGSKNDVERIVKFIKEGENESA